MSSLSKPKIKAMILDVLKLRSPSLPRFATLLAEIDGVVDVDVSLMEMDEKTESLKLVINGPDIDYEAFKKHIGMQGAAIHSVDQVIVEKDEE